MKLGPQSRPLNFFYWDVSSISLYDLTKKTIHAENIKNVISKTGINLITSIICKINVDDEHACAIG